MTQTLGRDEAAGTGYESIRVERSGRVLTVWLDRPERMNALSEAMYRELPAVLRDAETDDAVGAVVLTGAGRAFCAGGDIKGMRERAEQGPPDPAANRERMRGVAGFVMALRHFAKPLVVAANGAAVGAGLSVALTGDVVLAGRSSTFGIPFRKVGLVPDLGVTWILPRLIGLQAAKELALSGRLLDAEEAKARGLVWEVYEDEALLQRAQELAARFADGPTRTLAMAKELMNEAPTRDLQASLDAEGAFQSIAFTTPDHAEGVQAFVEKREPRFH